MNKSKYYIECKVCHQMFSVRYIERHTSSCQQDSMGIDNEINESAVVDYAAAVSSSGSCGPSDANQGDKLRT